MEVYGSIGIDQMFDNLLTLLYLDWLLLTRMKHILFIV